MGYDPGDMARGHSRRRRPRKGELIHSPPPVRLGRPPQTDLAARVDELDARVFSAAEAVASHIRGRIDASTSLAEMHLLHTQSELLPAMEATHRSVRRLLSAGDGEMDLSIDCLPLTRMQLERCFLSLLLADHPRWHTRYRKNAWKAFAEKFFRDRGMLAHLEPYAEYFGSSGPGVRLLRTFAREMDVSEDEIQTLRVQVTGDEPDPRFKQWFIPDMPTPGRCLKELDGDEHRALAAVLYPFYDNLSHFSHGGLVGLMQAAILRGEAEGDDADGVGEERRRFWSTHVLEQTLPASYVSILVVATLFARPHLPDPEAGAGLREALLGAWRPYHSDGSPIGVAVWDGWAGAVLDGADPADAPDGGQEG